MTMYMKFLTCVAK